VGGLVSIDRVLALSFVAVTILVVLRQQRPEMAMLFSLAVGATLLVGVLSAMAPSLAALSDLAAKAKVERYYLDTVLRVIGVAYLADFGAQVCDDAGERSLGRKVELAGKVIIMIMAIPLVSAVLEVILRLLP
jgi:stage III sporulation protein AD